MKDLVGTAPEKGTILSHHLRQPAIAGDPGVWASLFAPAIKSVLWRG